MGGRGEGEDDDEEKARTKKGRSGSAPCPDSTCVLVPSGRRIAARLFTNPSSTRLPELPLCGSRPLSPIPFNCPRVAAPSLPRFTSSDPFHRIVSGPALITVRREHPSSPTQPRPFCYNLIVSPHPFLSLYSKYRSELYFSSASFRLRSFPRMPPAGAVALTIKAIKVALSYPKLETY